MNELSDDRYQGQFRPEFSRLHRDRDLFWVVPFGPPLMVAVLGRRFTGKTAALSYLSERHGFRIYTLGGVLRELSRERGLRSGRLDLEAFGDEVRYESQDGAILARWVLRKIRRDQLAMPPDRRRQQRVGIAGIKHPEELQTFAKLESFRTLLLTTEDPEVRFQRARHSGLLLEEWLARNSAGDARQFRKLRLEGQREFFAAQLDSTYDAGHASPFPEEYRGWPSKVVEQVTDRAQAKRPFAPERIENDSRQLNDLLAQLNEVVSGSLIPRSHVMLS